MHKTRNIIIASIALYLVALAVAWVVCTRQAVRNTERMLTISKTVFDETIDDTITALLMHCSRAIVDYIGPSVRPLSVDEAVSLAEQFHIDELNVADANGITIGSNVPKVIGYDYHNDPLTAEYLVLTNSDVSFITQPFRHGITNPEVYCKYAGHGFEDGSGFVQLGFSYDRLVSALYRYDAYSMRHWAIGRSGHYDIATADYLPQDFPDGKMLRGMENGERIFFLAFTYAGRRYVSVLPEREYFGGRNVSFAILAPMLAAIVLLMIIFVRSLVRASSAEAGRRASEDAARSRDLDMARDIQLSCLASPGPYRRDIMSLSFDVLTKPAREVGGDFYDFYFLDSNHLALVMADVAGKGIPAAMFMMMAKNEIFNAMRELKNPVNALAEANRRICQKNDADMFVTVWVGVVDIETGTMVYVNAGHNRPFIRRADGTVEKQTFRGGRFIGVFPEAKYQSHRVELKPGDALFLYTDGVTEAMNASRELYGEKRLVNVLSSAELNAAALVAAVEADVSAFAGGAEQSDDFTALALVWHGQPKKIEREFPSTAESLGEAVKWLGEHVGLADKASRSRMLNAADEIVANVVSYSGARTYTLSVENAPDRTRVEVSDDGMEYNQLAKPAPNTHLPLEERPVGGLGILIIKRLVDSASYRRESGRNVLTILASNRA